MPRVAGSPQKMRERNTKACWLPPEDKTEAWDRLSLPASGRDRPCRHLDFRLVTSGTVRINFCCLQLIRHSSPRKLTHVLSRIRGKA